ncbi:MAG: diaminopimelate decarboxylase, partial [Gemmataceae bacterium]
MDHFHYKSGKLFCDQVPVQELAEAYGTPLYVYSAATLVHHLKQIQDAFKEVDPLICYSVKTNGNLSILKLMRYYG